MRAALNANGWSRASLAAAVCFANCDGSTTPPILNSNDFSCFMDSFAAQDPSADCDRNGVLNVNDYNCFLNSYAAGCGQPWDKLVDEA